MAYYSREPKVTLPRLHSEDDKKWITEQLLKLPGKYQIQARASYTDIYKETMKAEETEHRRENKARQAANTRLRLFVRNVQKAQQEAAQKQIENKPSNDFDWGD